MYRILEILIEDFENQKPSDAYQLAQFSEIETPFIASLSEEQKRAYFDMNNVQGTLQTIAFDNFAMYVFENLRKFF